jgi:DNA-binding PadR family transcriptional regulator
LQVLADLEAAGLAVSASPPQRGPGRPRKIYRLLTPREWAATHGRGKAS